MPSFTNHPKALFWSKQNDPNINLSSLKWNQKYFFDCNKCPHTFSATLANITKGSWCPYCANKKLCHCNLCLQKSLFKQHPNLFEDNEFTDIRWSFETNKEIDPKLSFPSSNKAAYFYCTKLFECGCPHIFESKISDVVTTVFKRGKNGCPFCMKGGKDKKFCIHESLEGKHPEIAKYWDFGKNGDILPSQVLPNCNDEFFWNCDGCPKCGLIHSYKSSPNTKLSRNTGCSYCVEGTQSVCPCSSVAVLYPNLLEEWDDEKNSKDINLYQISKGSKREFNWICIINKNHRWVASISNRTYHESGCPDCYRESLVDWNTKLQNIKQELEIVVYRIIPNNDTKCIKVWGHCKGCNDIFCKTLRTIYNHGGPYCKDCTEYYRLQKIKNTNIKKYGTSSIFGNKDIREKWNLTYFQKTGYKHPLQNPQVIEKIRQTNQSKSTFQHDKTKEKRMNTTYKNHGVYFPAQSEEIRKKMQATCLERFNFPFASQNKNIMDKAIQTNLHNRGVSYASQDPKVKEKIKLTNSLRYIGGHPLRDPDVKKKRIATVMARYGVEHVSQNLDIKNKQIATVMARYGVDHVSQLDHVKNKKIETSNKNWGTDHPMQNPSVFDSCTGYKWKEYNFKCGKKINVQGYEPFALDIIIEDWGLGAEDIITERSEVPEIWFTDTNSKNHRYYADIYIPFLNKIIEVKSLWTFKCKKDSVIMKYRSAKASGFDIEIWVMSPNGKILFVV
jgi:hypothetical protein